jgi:CubicO group peptidase (beta-lactamase class C family)
VPRLSRRFLFALTVAAMVPAAAQAPAGLTAEATSRVDRLVQDEMTAQKIPGLSVAVATENQLRLSKGYGVSDLENNVPARAETIYRLASISKPITAVAAMQLAESGKLDLDAPVQKYVPGFPQKEWLVTCRQLLGHLGGVRHYKSGEVSSTRHYEDLTAPLSIFKDDPLLHEPGTKYLYTTYGYNLLGAAVEGASGQKFPEYLRANIFQRAGMERIRVDDVFAIIPNRAQGYQKRPDGTLVNSILADTSNKIPGGGLCSTAADLVRFGIAVQTDRLLKPETRARMWTRQKLRDGSETAYGLGWALSSRNGKREVAHGGAQPRVATYLYLRPDDRCTVAIMSNLEGTKLPDLARKIADAATMGN